MEVLVLFRFLREGPKLLSVTSRRRNGGDDSHLAGKSHVTDSLECCVVFLFPLFLSCSPMGIKAVIPGRKKGLSLFSSKKGTATVLQLQAECLLCVVGADSGWNAE